MAGFYDRVDDLGLDGDGGGRVNISLVFSNMIAIAANMAPFDGTLNAAKAAFRDILNVELQKNDENDALRPEDETDLAAIVDELDTQTSTLNKLVYSHKLQSMLNLAELGQTTEVQFRANLGI